MADPTPSTPPAHSPDNCAPCRIVATLAQHRDTTAADWSLRRGTLNFAIIIAQREYPVRGGVS